MIQSALHWIFSEIAEESNTCDQCGLNMPGIYDFCSHGGADNTDEEKNIIEYYFRRGFKYKTILDFHSKYHGVNICMQTLKYRLKKYGLSRHCSSYNIEEVRQRIIQELDGPRTWEAIGQSGIHFRWRVFKYLAM